MHWHRGLCLRLLVPNYAVVFRLTYIKSNYININTYIYTYIHIYICICVCVCVWYKVNMLGEIHILWIMSYSFSQISCLSKRNLPYYLPLAWEVKLIYCLSLGYIYIYIKKLNLSSCFREPPYSVEMSGLWFFKYWKNYRNNISQNSSCKATYLPSQKTSKSDE